MADAQLAESVEQVLGQVHGPISIRMTRFERRRSVARRSPMLPRSSSAGKPHSLPRSIIADGDGDQIVSHQPLLGGLEAIGQAERLVELSLSGEISRQVRDRDIT